MNKKLTILTGATASGKTKLSIAIAKKIDAVIICADSRIVYKDFDIVSAKPTIEERSNIPHYLIDIISPNQDFSAGDFVSEAKKIIDNTNKNIIITGGTWFYIKSLLDKKALPDCPIDKALREELSTYDNQELWEKLNKIDPKRASLIHPNNKDKVIRSIEMCKILNMPISEYNRKDNNSYSANWYMPDITREELYDRINQRVDEMINLGLYDEWLNISKKYPNSKVAKNTIGYKEFFELQEGIYQTKAEAIEKIKQHTRNFAKRQLTYFRSNQNIKPVQSVDEILEDIE